MNSSYCYLSIMTSIKSTSDPADSVQEGYVFPLVLGEMKGASLPLPSAAILPSPILPWRFKIRWDSIMRMGADLQDLFLYEAFLYYNPLLLVTMMV
ncbi:hypothetical protein SLEP1_g45958 [Rubroshorea leprosula]|uniref:Uncharacterized protein n=1 Tax=Rubroshorea leprosula TaxID=152421 RepID=A0AAV5LKP2_9ROSI|nr:hypothetical protein SLEP1_g45958 [Rubroshorea leprosula]